MNERAEKALQEMLDISTDIDKAVVYAGAEVLAANFPVDIRKDRGDRAQELGKVGGEGSQGRGAGELTQLMVETDQVCIFLVRETEGQNRGILATGKKDSRVGLVFYDMKTCMRDTREEDED